MDEILRLWKTRRRAIAKMDWPACSAVLYQLDKCILDLELELQYERALASGTTEPPPLLVEPRDEGKRKL